MIDSVDRPAEVAAVVARESAWVPAWRRLVARAAAAVLPGLLLLGLAPPPAAAGAAVLLALGSRLAPAVVAGRLRRDCSPASVRRLREALLSVYVVTGVLTAAALPRAAPESLSLVPALLAGLLVVLQHRPTSSVARLAVAAEVVESAALVTLLPALAVATSGWWR
jgi:hypothetical protein